MTVETPLRPTALAELKEIPVSTVVQEGGSYCTFHGKQEGLSCLKCDEHYPEAVQARKLDAAPLSMGILPADVQKMIDAAVKQAVAQAVQFEQWKASPEGKAAAAVAPTAGVVPPDHGPRLGDPSSTVTPVA